MALIECPDCGRKVSDRARTCPDCACPVAEVMAEQRAEARQREVVESRRALDKQVDCPRCEARGMYELGDGYVEWCPICEATGRIVLCEAADGFYAVAEYAIERFEAGELHPRTSGVVFYLGTEAPTRFRFPKPSKRFPVDPDDIPWDIESDPQQKDLDLA
jgi:hypothetical protein